MFDLFMMTMFCCLAVTISIMLLSNIFVKTPENKYFWGKIVIASSAITMLILLTIQNLFIEDISIFRNSLVLSIASKYLPYFIWGSTLYFLCKSEIAKNKNNFRKTHFNILYAYVMCLIAIIIPFMNIIFSIMSVFSDIKNINVDTTNFI